MGGEQSHFLCPAAGGLCLQRESNNYIRTAEFDGNEAQQWFLEREGTKLAFRNRQSNQYLRALGGNHQHQLITGEKQWWTLETGNTPRSYWIKSEAFPNAYLCNSFGNYAKGNVVWMWSKQEIYKQTMLWYMYDFPTWQQHVNSSPSVNFAGPGAAQDASVQKQEQEKLTQDKQAALEQREKEVEEKEKAALAMQQQLETKAKEYAVAQKEIETKEKEVSERRQQLEAEQTATAEKQSQLEAREREVAQQEAAENGGDIGSANQVTSLQRQLSDAQGELEESRAARHKLAAKEEELVQREQQLSKAKQDLARSPQADGSSSWRPNASLPPRSDGRIHDTPPSIYRTEPVDFRTNTPRPATKDGEVAPTKMPQGFGYLPRLQAS